MKELKLKYYWWAYLLIILFPIVVWNIVFAEMQKPADNEKISILYVGESLDAEKLQKDLTDILPELTDQYVEVIYVNTIILDEAHYYDVLRTRMYTCDIIIIEEDYMKDNVGRVLFKRFPMDKMPDDFSSVQYYCEETEIGNKEFGFVLNQDSKLMKYIGKDAKCYVFVSPISANLGGLYGEGNTEDQAALDLLKYLLKQK